MVALEKETGLSDNPLQVKFTEQGSNSTTCAPSPAPQVSSQDSRMKFYSVVRYGSRGITRYRFRYMKKYGKKMKETYFTVGIYLKNRTCLAMLTSMNDGVKFINLDDYGNLDLFPSSI